MGLARQAWFEVVISGATAHRFWGVHLRMARYTGGRTTRKNATSVGDYFWRESGKLSQKSAPEGFGRVKWWDVWGMEPVEAESRVTEAAFYEWRRSAILLRDKKTGAKVQRPRGLDGLAVTNVRGMETGRRLADWAEIEGTRKEPGRAERRDARRDAQRRARERREAEAQQEWWQEFGIDEALRERDGEDRTW